MLQPRIFFDTNRGTDEYGYDLLFEQSRRDIAALEQPVHEGMKVVIYMPNELEMDATLEFRGDHWVGVPIPGSIRYLDGSA
jgi:hypothetical protein